MRALLIPCVVALLPQLALAAPETDFTRDVKPVLVKHCIGCHGPDKQCASLRLDSAKAVHEGGSSGAAVIAGKSNESLLIKAVLGVDDVKVMPPKGKRLTSAEVAPCGAGSTRERSARRRGGCRSREEQALVVPARRPPHEPTVKNCAGRATPSTASSSGGWRKKASPLRPRPTASRSSAGCTST